MVLALTLLVSVLAVLAVIRWALREGRRHPRGPRTTPPGTYSDWGALVKLLDGSWSPPRRRRKP